MSHSTILGTGCGQTLFFVNVLAPSTGPELYEIHSHRSMDGHFQRKEVKYLVKMR